MTPGFVAARAVPDERIVSLLRREWERRCSR